MEAIETNNRRGGEWPPERSSLCVEDMRRDLGGAVRALYNFARTSVTAALGTLSLPLSLRDLIHGEDDGGPDNRRLRVV